MQSSAQDDDEARSFEPLASHFHCLDDINDVCSRLITSVKFDSFNVTFINSVEQLHATRPVLSSAAIRIVAVDVEHSTSTFHGLVCTVQVAVPGHPPMVFDTLSPDIRPLIAPLLGPVLGSSRIVKVMHAGRNDVLWLSTAFGLHVRGPVLDTAVAAQALGLPTSLATLSQHLLGAQGTAGTGAGSDTALNWFTKHKAQYQRADWRRRPLPADYIKYAGIDSAVLLPVATLLWQRLHDGSVVEVEDRATLLAKVLSRSQQVTRSRYDAHRKETYGKKEEQLALDNALKHIRIASSATTSLTSSILPGCSQEHAVAVAAWLATAVAHWVHTYGLHEDINPALILPTATLPARVGMAVSGVLLQSLRQRCGAPALPEQQEQEEDRRQGALAQIQHVCDQELPTAYSDAAAAFLFELVQDCASILSRCDAEPASPVLRTHHGRALLGAMDSRGGSKDIEEAIKDLCDAMCAVLAGAASPLEAAGVPKDDSGRADTASACDPLAKRDAAKQARAARIFTPRAAPLYSNIELCSPDGVPMARIDRKKAQWYLDVGAVDVLSGGSLHIGQDGQLLGVTADEGAEPLRLRLKQAPKGLGHAGDTFHLSPRVNVCVICGVTWEAAQSTGGLVRCYLIPRAHRHHFPLAAKSYTSHDVVLSCTGCHRRADVSASALTRAMCSELGVATGGGAMERLRQQWFDAGRWKPVVDAREAQADSATERPFAASAHALALVHSSSEGAWPPDTPTINRALCTIRRLSHALVYSWLHVPHTRRLALAQELLAVLQTARATPAGRDTGCMSILDGLEAVRDSLVPVPGPSPLPAHAGGGMETGSTLTTAAAAAAAVLGGRNGRRSKKAASKRMVPTQGTAGQGALGIAGDAEPVEEEGGTDSPSVRAFKQDWPTWSMQHLHTISGMAAPPLPVSTLLFYAHISVYTRLPDMVRQAMAGTSGLPGPVHAALEGTGTGRQGGMAGAEGTGIEGDMWGVVADTAGVQEGEGECEEGGSTGARMGVSATTTCTASCDSSVSTRACSREVGSTTGSQLSRALEAPAFASSHVNSLALWADPAAHILRHVLLGTQAWAKAAGVVPGAGGRGDGQEHDAPFSAYLQQVEAGSQAHPAGGSTTAVPVGVGLSGLPLPVEQRLSAFIYRWRAHMHATLRPAALPVGWDVRYKVFTSGHRTWDKEEPHLVKLIQAELGLLSAPTPTSPQT